MPSLTRRHFLASTAALAATAPMAQVKAQGAKLNIVATTGMIADAARAVGGELVDVKGLMGPGIDPHAYRQTRTDILAMSRADLVLWNGHFLEAQMESFLLDLKERSKVYAVAEVVPRESLISHDDYENRFDPHVWMDPDLWKHSVQLIGYLTVGMIGRKWQDMDAVDEVVATVDANERAYAADIEMVSAYAKKVLATVPEQSRVVISAHDAFNYFGAAYGFDVVGIQGISTESEAGILRIRELVDMIVERDIRAVFVESSVADRSVRALVEGAQARGHALTIGGELFSDAMGNFGTYEGTYIGMIDHNATTIARALGGEAPEFGMKGKLVGGDLRDA